MPAVAHTTRGQRVAARRDALALTQEELARRCRITTRTLQRVEAGRNASARVIRALHRALGIPLGELVNAARRGRGA